MDLRALPQPPDPVGTMREAQFVTTDTKDTEAIAHERLVRVAKTEQAIERAYQPIADSLMVSGKKGVEEFLKHQKDAIKAFLNESSEPFIHDGELGWTAKLQARQGTPTYDLVTCANTEAGPEAIIEAARAGMLRIDHSMLRDFRKESGAGWADVINRFQMPGTGTIALLIGPPK